MFWAWGMFTISIVLASYEASFKFGFAFSYVNEQLSDISSNIFRHFILERYFFRKSYKDHKRNWKQCFSSEFLNGQKNKILAKNIQTNAERSSHEWPWENTQKSVRIIFRAKKAREADTSDANPLAKALKQQNVLAKKLFKNKLDESINFFCQHFPFSKLNMLF